MYMYMYNHVYVYVYVYICVCISLYISLSLYIYIYIYMYIHTYIRPNRCTDKQADNADNADGRHTRAQNDMDQQGAGEPLPQTYHSPFFLLVKVLG